MTTSLTFFGSHQTWRAIVVRYWNPFAVWVTFCFQWYQNIQCHTIHAPHHLVP